MNAQQAQQETNSLSSNDKKYFFLDAIAKSISPRVKFNQKNLHVLVNMETDVTPEEHHDSAWDGRVYTKQPALAVCKDGRFYLQYKRGFADSRSHTSSTDLHTEELKEADLAHFSVAQLRYAFQHLTK